MAQVATIIGLPQVLKNLSLRAARLQAECAKGLKVAGLMLQRASQLKVPVDTGNLKASAFTRAEGVGFATQVRVGYTAEYALYVHELVGMKLKGLPRRKPHKGRYWDPQGRGQAKFLEEPARQMGPELLRVVRDHMRIL